MNYMYYINQMWLIMPPKGLVAIHNYNYVYTPHIIITDHVAGSSSNTMITTCDFNGTSRGTSSTGGTTNPTSGLTTDPPTTTTFTVNTQFIPSITFKFSISGAAKKLIIDCMYIVQIPLLMAMHV